MDHKEFINRLFDMSDSQYAELSRKTNPSIDPSLVIGVRTPALRAFAKELRDSDFSSSFIKELPHKYFEENQMHAFLISLEKDFDKCINNVDLFLPYVDNWATCDQMNPPVFKKHHKELLNYVDRWINSKDVYAVRFAIKVLMDHFLEDDFDPKYMELVSGIVSEEYYIRMMVAWYFATALAKQRESAIVYFVDHRLDPVIHKMAVRKSIDSFRIDQDTKNYLRTL